MICANCHKPVTYGYFWEGESVKYICTDCLLLYRSGKVKKYDREQIMRMHDKGYSNETIAAVMGTNRLTIGCIIRKEEKREQDEIQRRRLAEAKKSD